MTYCVYWFGNLSENRILVICAEYSLDSSTQGGDLVERLERDGLTITWLNGGVTHMDGGAMFGVVPKPLWSRKYPHNDKNQIELRTDPMLIEKDGKRILVEAGIGNERLDEKQRRNYGVLEESSVETKFSQAWIGSF